MLIKTFFRPFTLLDTSVFQAAYYNNKGRGFNHTIVSYFVAVFGRAVPFV